MMATWTEGPNGKPALMVNMRPTAGRDGPRLMARLDEGDVIGGFERVQGEFRVIAQVDRVLTASEQVSVIRVLQDVPPTPLEMNTIRAALGKLAAAGSGLGLTLSNDDLEVSHPTVVVRPIAIYK